MIVEEVQISIFYMILVLPCLFGLTVLTDGLGKILKGEMSGWGSILLGLFFEAIVVLAYFLLAGRK